MSETDLDRKARFAYALRRSREQRGLTPPQLAQRIGVSRGTVNRWEDPLSQDAPSILKLGPLCVALNADARLFAVLPPEPPSEVDEYLVADAVLQGLSDALDDPPAEAPEAQPAPRSRRRLHALSGGPGSDGQRD